MPILTKDIAKRILQINVTTYDTLIDEVLPVIQREIIGYCNNDFRVPDAPLYSPSGALIYPSGSRYNYEALRTPTGFVLSSGISFSNTTISDSNSGFTTAGFVAGMDVAVQGSMFNNSVYAITEATAGALTLDLASGWELITEPAGHYVLIAAVVFPRELRLPASSLLKMLIDKNFGSGKSSESIGDYSVSFSSSDFPDSVKQQLNRFRKLKIK